MEYLLECLVGDFACHLNLKSNSPFSSGCVLCDALVSRWVLLLCIVGCTSGVSFAGLASVSELVLNACYVAA